jgi:hypothetical protein
VIGDSPTTQLFCSTFLVRRQQVCTWYIQDWTVLYGG